MILNAISPYQAIERCICNGSGPMPNALPNEIGVILGGDTVLIATPRSSRPSGWREMTSARHRPETMPRSRTVSAWRKRSYSEYLGMGGAGPQTCFHL
jgi:hypothetical protein